jgi:hypothetical protein
MKGLAVCVVSISIALALAGPASAQRDYGDGFAIGGVLLPSGSPQLLANTRIGDAMGLELGVGFDIEDGDAISRTDLEAGIGLKYYMTGRNQFQSFIGGRFGMRHSSWDLGDGDEEDTRFGVSAFLGGEYFVNRNLSVEGALEFNMFFGSVELETGSRLAAFFYL